MPMTKTITVYTLHELSAAARDRAYTRWLETYLYGWAADDAATLEAFCSVFPVKVTHWEYDAFSYDIRCRLKEDYLHENVPGLSGWRLATYIWNNYGNALFRGKYYARDRRENGRYVCVHRRSKVILEASCVLTGYCRDEDILEPVYRFLQRPDSTTFAELMRRCCEAWGQACMVAYEADTSKDTFVEMCDANGWLFTEDGSLA
jgi:hypothetical protein